MPSAEPIAYYRLLFDGHHTEPGWDNNHYLALLNEHRRGKKLVPLALQDVGGDEPPPAPRPLPVPEAGGDVPMIPLPEGGPPPAPKRAAGCGGGVRRGGKGDKGGGDGGKGGGDGGKGGGDGGKGGGGDPGPPPPIDPPPIVDALVLPLPEPEDVVPPHEIGGRVPNKWFDSIDGAQVCWKDWKGYKN